MLARLVVPLAFLIGLASLFFVMQNLSSPPKNTDSTTNSPDSLKQFEIKPIPPISATITDSQGKKIDIVTLITKPTLVTFWSIECGECEKGLPDLDAFANNQEKILVIIIDTKDASVDAEAKLSSLKVGLKTYYDTDGSAFQAWEAVMPSSYYVDEQIRYFFPGRISNDLLQQLLNL